MRPRLDRRRFRRWLENHAPHDFVGWADCERGCPVALFLWETYLFQAIVGRKSWWGEGTDTSHKTSRWAARFITTIDTTTPRNFRVTAQRALEILDGIPA